jgi:predicted nucleic acid-binding protein
LADVRVLLDTTAFIDVLRRMPAARDFLHSLRQRPLASEVSRVEVLRGLRAGERPTAERLFAEIGWVPVDEAVARLAGELGRKHARSHRGISATDLIVAATAQHVGASLATSNTKHYPMFPRLKPPY